MPLTFANDLLNWYRNVKRDLPWRDTNDPYRIWISEVMSQQTRIDTVIPYYNRFTEAFPTVYDLASAERQQVLKLWEGLGYYSRARNLQDAAKTVVEEYDGKVPSDYDEIIKLKGVGPYTAAAVLSIAFNKPHAVMDGNVMRVITRFYGIESDIRSTHTKKEIQQLADNLIPESNPGDFNQGLMELGATVCTPSSPACSDCPLQLECTVAHSVRTETIPYKSPAKKVPHHQIAVGLIVNSEGELLIALRPEDVMLGGLWEFPGGKKEKGEKLNETVARELKEELGVEVEVLDEFQSLKHAYSHFKITLTAFWCRIEKGTPKPKSGDELRWVSLNQIDEYPFPKANKTLIGSLLEMDAERLRSEAGWR
ncbi:MAG: A/G-specific adenine glycosylase [Balneolaceae bacterium]|nr:A/G-specific adenine glycosylase [Balneolaceae bacterium]